jgi:predicted anti-sigma-YlaC factor YlaD
MKNSMLYSCRQATSLVAQQEEGKLNLVQRTKLWLHLNMCKACSLFSKQTALLGDAAKQIQNIETNLPEKKKLEIIEKLKNE